MASNTEKEHEIMTHQIRINPGDRGAMHLCGAGPTLLAHPLESTTRSRGAMGLQTTRSTLGIALSSLLVPCLGLAAALVGCDVEDHAREDEPPAVEETRFRAGCIGGKKCNYPGGRPSFTQAARNVCSGVPGSVSVNHFISWSNIFAGYQVALNPKRCGEPATTTNCIQNLGLLYQAVGLDPEGSATEIATVCDAENRDEPTVTDEDIAVLSELNSSISNLRCGHSGPNSSIGEHLDVPCDAQYHSTDGIIITEPYGDRIYDYYRSDNKSTVQVPDITFRVVKVLCEDQMGSGACDQDRVQTSDCGQDFADAVPEETMDVYIEAYGKRRQIGQDV